jgi:hypothetical protein
VSSHAARSNKQEQAAMVRWAMGWAVACGLAGITAGLSVAGLSGADAQTATTFPFERELLLDAAPMRPSKRMPSITIATDGQATIDLWCRTVTARVALAEGSLTIITDVSPEALDQQDLPAMQGPGQCSEPRLRADADLLSALIQTTGWRRQGEAVVLTGAVAPMRFQPATN